MKLVEGLTVLMLGAVIGAGLAYLLKANPCADNNIQIDTVWQQTEIDTNKLFSEWKLKLKPNTIYITEKDTIEIPTELEAGNWFRSTIDTTVEQNNAKASLLIESYAKCPVDLSILDLIIESTCIDTVITLKEIETRTIEITEPFYKDSWFYVALLEFAGLIYIIANAF